MKKGFATSAVFYTVFVLFLVLMVSILNNLQNKKTILDNIKLETIQALDNVTQCTINKDYTIDVLHDVYYYSAANSGGTIATLDVADYDTVTIDSMTFSQSNNMKVEILKDDVSYAQYGVTTTDISIDVTDTEKLKFNLIAGSSSSERITITGVTVASNSDNNIESTNSNIFTNITTSGSYDKYYSSTLVGMSWINYASSTYTNGAINFTVSKDCTVETYYTGTNNSTTLTTSTAYLKDVTTGETIVNMRANQSTTQTLQAGHEYQLYCARNTTIATTVWVKVVE